MSCTVVCSYELACGFIIMQVHKLASYYSYIAIYIAI